MNYKISTSFLILILLSFIACDKNETAIKYESEGDFGLNILDLTDSSTISPNISYSFSANLEKDANLQIELINLSTPSGNLDNIWSFSNIQNVGWLVYDYNFQYNTQIFESSQSGNIDLPIEFSSSGTGNPSCQINFYENGGTLTKTSYLFW